MSELDVFLLNHNSCSIIGGILRTNFNESRCHQKEPLEGDANKKY